MNNYAYVTLLSSIDYLPAIIILNNSFKQVQSKYPLVIAVTENIIQEAEYYLKQEKILYKVIPVIQYHKNIQMKYENSSILNTASKISILTFYEYDKIIFIDGDTVIYKNIDELFNYPDGAMLRENDSNLSGLMVLIPQNHDFRYYYTLLQLFPELDGNIFEGLLFPCKSNPQYQIPMIYFIDIMLQNLSSYNIEDIYSIQFCFKFKPWKYLTPEAFIAEYKKSYSNTEDSLRFIIVKKYMEEYLYPLWKKYPELQVFCKNN